MTEYLSADMARSLLPARPANAHKGIFGKALIVAGSPQYPGAASLCTAGAARVGAGIVTLAASRSMLGGPGRLAEITYLLLPEAEWGTLGESAADELLKKIGDYQSLLIGPGLGQEATTARFLKRLLALDSVRSNKRAGIGFRPGASAVESETERVELPPCVLDADALNLLSKQAEPEGAWRGDFFRPEPATRTESSAELSSWWEHLPREHFVLTPHIGEMQRLLNVEALDVDHAQVASEAAQRWGQIVVLKSSTTVIADPQGRTVLYKGENPALATGGSGDVLAGAIAGLLAQGLTAFNAALLGVYLHGAAAKIVRDVLGDMGAIASDLLPRLPLAIRSLKG